MNLAEFSIRKHIITWTMTGVVLGAGYLAYQSLGRLEDPEFVIKQAVVATPYPGASAREVEKEVTEVIEKAVQELGQLKYIESYSERGLSKVSVYIKDQFDKETLPQGLGRAASQSQRRPSRSCRRGRAPSDVQDDFGDVYGVYSPSTARATRTPSSRAWPRCCGGSSSRARDVKKIVFHGEQKETVFVEISRTKANALGSPWTRSSGR